MGKVQFREIIQVAGIIDQTEAQMLVRAGVTHLGFPLRLAVHKEDISEENAGKIIRALPPPFYGVLIMYLKEAADVVKLCHRIGTRKVQLHADILPSQLAILRKLDKELFIMKSLIIRDDNFTELEAQIAVSYPFVDAFITDTYDPGTGAYGATGKTHNWDISKKLVSFSPRPVILAGGLRPDNVREAITYVHPAGVDVHTGVELSNGRKDPYLVRRFVAEAKEAFWEMIKQET